MARKTHKFWGVRHVRWFLKWFPQRICKEVWNEADRDGNEEKKKIVCFIWSYCYQDENELREILKGLK